MRQGMTINTVGISIDGYEFPTVETEGVRREGGPGKDFKLDANESSLQLTLVHKTDNKQAMYTEATANRRHEIQKRKEDMAALTKDINRSRFHTGRCRCDQALLARLRNRFLYTRHLARRHPARAPRGLHVTELLQIADLELKTADLELLPIADLEQGGQTQTRF
eukprot:g81079.t1